ncbi:hypothetical protein RvY_16043 [Ramazzottius varieornatus]|uniref:Uncharacterized protein n=1 Tax=Ramazzottius varieornatus TaxID=947166 RepID=A0A1D1VX23_RAMVA|nr:hypothetical protein RvY_16043 [Ramazzottius varieornatus]
MLPSQLMSYLLLCGLLVVCVSDLAEGFSSTASPPKLQVRSWLLHQLANWKLSLSGGRESHGAVQGATKQRAGTVRSTTKFGRTQLTSQAEEGPHPSDLPAPVTWHSSSFSSPNRLYPATATRPSVSASMNMTTHLPPSKVTPMHRVASSTKTVKSPTHPSSTSRALTYAPITSLTSTSKSSTLSASPVLVPHSTEPTTTSEIELLSDAEEPVGEISQPQSQRSARKAVQKQLAVHPMMPTSASVRLRTATPTPTRTSSPNTTTTTDLPQVQVLSELESEIYNAIASDLGYGNLPKQPAEAAETRRTSRHSTTRRRSTRTRSTSHHRPPPGEYARLLEMYLGGQGRPMHQQQRPPQMMHFGGSAEGGD